MGTESESGDGVSESGAGAMGTESGPARERPSTGVRARLCLGVLELVLGPIALGRGAHPRPLQPIHPVHSW